MKTVMVDLDDTIVAFSEMFVNRTNSIMSSGRFITNERFGIDDFQSYDIIDMFKNKMTNPRVSYKTVYTKICDEIYADETFYKNPIYTKESLKIFKLLDSFKETHNLILNTKISTLEMAVSKSNLFKFDKRFNVFDRIILDLEKGSHTPKPTDYDIMIDDSPYNIEEYLDKNKTGKIYMPLRPWNKQFEGHEQIIIL